MAGGVEQMISNGAACLSHLVGVLQYFYSMMLKNGSMFLILVVKLSGILVFQPTESPTCL